MVYESAVPDWWSMGGLVHGAFRSTNVELTFVDARIGENCLTG